VAALRNAAQPWTVLAAGALAAGLSVETVRVIAPGTSGWLALMAGLAVGGPLALAWWRPLAAVTLAWIAAAAYSRLLAPLDGSLSDVGLVFATSFVVAALSTRRAAVLGLVACWAGQVLGVGADDPLGETLLLLLCWLGGLAVNEVSRLVEQTRVNNELLARGEEAFAQHAIVEERLRLAREIHDVVGHSLTVVALQAGAARRLASVDPEQAQQALRTAAEVARQGVAAMVTGEQGVDLASLIEHTRATGLVLEADLADLHMLAPEQETVAVRVVQEALTNVLRHAPGAEASVAVRSRDHEVEIVVRNSAPARAGTGPGSGRGLPGLRERVAAAAGRMTWREREDGGFEVRALLPIGALAEAR
jgi:signal transduction histidine kinase